MGSYALLRALSSSNLAESRALGFFRQNAALAVVTISDENDICAIYPSTLPPSYTLPGSLWKYPKKPGLTTSEVMILNRDCPNGISTDQVINAIKSVQGDRPYVISAVIHTDINYHDAGGIDSYGWGYADVVEKAHGVLVDIGDASFTAGLSQIGVLTTKKLSLLSDFILSHSNVDSTSIDVTVDHNPVTFDYNANQNEVHLNDQLGGALSEIAVSYCEKKVTPTPTPTVTSNPSPSPSPSPTVTASPSPSPSPTATCSGPFCGPAGAT